MRAAVLALTKRAASKKYHIENLEPAVAGVGSFGKQARRYVEAIRSHLFRLTADGSRGQVRVMRLQAQ
jgi:hypothetical protein